MGHNKMQPNYKFPLAVVILFRAKWNILLIISALFLNDT